ncbi:ATP synthase F1 subunit delta [Blattabacterium clevelandi]|uniref:ATP synthase F1 subunit delta n=1 Tax=Blattabacterium clevelandi TaxID=164516 RepID=UPI000DE57FDB|nr:ATP synthase F1 subunit delta [Blattabacterium clevelandi]
MFSKRRIIKHYAMVLFESSMKNHNMDSIYQKIKKISFLLSNNVELNKFFHSSLLNSERKIQILEKIFYSFDIFIFHFIKILIIRHREYLIKRIFLEYQKIYKEKKGLLKCIITSFFPLSIDIQKMIIHKIISSEKSKNKKYHIINKIDKSLIGGFLFRIGYKEWDFSVKNQLLSIQNIFKNSI